MEQNIVYCQVKDEYIIGSGQVVGAVGSHDDVLLRLDFSESPSWRGLTKRCVFTNALGEHPTPVVLTPNLLAEGQTEIYLCPVPAEAKTAEGMCLLTIQGVQMSGDVETIKAVTQETEFKVLPSRLYLSPDQHVTPDQADQLNKAIHDLDASIPGQVAEAVKPHINEHNMDPDAHQDIRTKVNTKLDSATIKSAGIPEIVSAETLRSYFYGKRKDTSRSWQFEISSGNNENIINALGGFPEGHTASEKWFLYIDLPYTEAGGFVIHAQLEGRDNGLLYRQDQFATLDQRWHTTGWIQIQDVQANLDDHIADQSNPHGVTAAQAGADPSGTATAADCFDEAASPTSQPNTWYVSKDLPRPSGEVGMTVDVRWKNGHADGLGYAVSLIWGEPDGMENETIVEKANVSDALTGEYSIPTEGTVRYQLIEQSGRKRWMYVSGPLLPKQYSSASAIYEADKQVPGLQLEYLPGMEIYVQLIEGNTASVARLVPGTGPTLPVYGNGIGKETGPVPAGYILQLKNAADHWQIINAVAPTKLSQLESDAEHRTVTDAQMKAWDAGGTEVADANAEKWATVKVAETISEITDEATFRTYFYELRKDRSRKYQFEISTGGLHENIVTGVGGRPRGADAADSAFIYVEIPFSEAGGYIIHVTYELRSKPGIWEKKLYATLDSRWNDTGWYQPAFISRVVIAPHGAGSKADMTASEIINAARRGVVLADYTDPKTGELRTYQYFKQMPDGRACFAINGYIENGTPKQTLIYVDYSGNVTTETRDATAEGVGARPDSWMPTAKDVGAAPEGFGLGAEKPEIIETPEEANKNGWYYVNGGVSEFSGFFLLFNSRLDHDNITRQFAFPASSSYSGSILTRLGDGSPTNWEPWEWVNPPMAPGVEYRTTERFDGHPVYVKKCNTVSALPGGTKTQVPFGQTVYKVIRGSAMVGGVILPIYGNTAVNEDSLNAFISGFSDSKAFVWVGNNRAGSQIEVTIWYTKAS